MQYKGHGYLCLRLTFFTLECKQMPQNELGCRKIDSEMWHLRAAIHAFVSTTACYSRAKHQLQRTVSFRATLPETLRADGGSQVPFLKYSHFAFLCYKNTTPSVFCTNMSDIVVYCCQVPYRVNHTLELMPNHHSQLECRIARCD